MITKKNLLNIMNKYFKINIRSYLRKKKALSCKVKKRNELSSVIDKKIFHLNYNEPLVKLMLFYLAQLSANMQAYRNLNILIILCDYIK